MDGNFFIFYIFIFVTRPLNVSLAKTDSAGFRIVLVLVWICCCCCYLFFSLFHCQFSLLKD